MFEKDFVEILGLAALEHIRHVVLQSALFGVVLQKSRKEKKKKMNIIYDTHAEKDIRTS